MISRSRRDADGDAEEVSRWASQDSATLNLVHIWTTHRSLLDNPVEEITEARLKQRQEDEKLTKKNETLF